MELISPELASDLGLIRKLFTSVFLPKDFPDNWSTVAKFASVTSGNSQVTEENVKVMIENLQAFNDHAFYSDKQLLSEFLSFSPNGGRPIGIALISNATICKLWRKIAFEKIVQAMWPFILKLLALLLVHTSTSTAKISEVDVILGSFMVTIQVAVNISMNVTGTS